MAKPQRMFVLTLVALWCGLTPHAWQPTESGTGWSIVALGLIVVIAGGIVTTVRRLTRIARILRKDP